MSLSAAAVCGVDPFLSVNQSALRSWGAGTASGVEFDKGTSGFAPGQAPVGSPSTAAQQASFLVCWFWWSWNPDAAHQLKGEGGGGGRESGVYLYMQMT